MKLALPAGSTSVPLHIFINDPTVTTGAGKAGLLYSDITAYYVRGGGTLTALTMETIATPGTWASGGNDHLGFILLHDTHAKGGYELNLPNNILAAGANHVTIFLSGVLLAPCNIEIQLAAVPANLISILGTTLTETAGYLAAGFKKLFNVATPVLDMTSVIQSGDTYGRLGAAGAGLTALGDTRIANLDAAVSTRATVATILAGNVEDSITVAHAMQAILAACAGKSDGGGTTTLHFRDQADSKNRITATVDANGDRTAITLSYD